MTKSRFAPSPTGLLHTGNVRTALHAYLAAKSRGGDFLLRIEDTDHERSDAMYAEQLMTDLLWLGIKWDEGPQFGGVGGGEKGPYYQSEREEIYESFYQKLMDEGKVYPCFCTEEQLKLSRKVQMTAGLPPRYSGTCRHLSEDEVARKKNEGLSFTLRFHVPDHDVIEFNDLVKGHQVFKGSDIGDFIIKRSNGASSFMFANAIDDALMGVDLVVRGEDHLTNSPRQIWILKALDLPIPTYVHISLIVAPSGKPLSKREGSQSLKELRELGFLPNALLNYYARLGHKYFEDSLLTLSGLETNFSTEKLSSSPARYDANQLLYWQKEAVLQADVETIAGWCEKPAALDETSWKNLVAILQPNVVFPKDLELWLQNLCQVPNYHDVQAILAEAGNQFFKELELLLQEDTDYASLLSELSKKTNKKGKALFMPFRVLLTGVTNGPELKAIYDWLGPLKVKERIQRVLELLK